MIRARRVERMEGPRSSPAGPTGRRRYGRLGSLRHSRQGCLRDQDNAVTDNLWMRAAEKKPAPLRALVYECRSEAAGYLPFDGLAALVGTVAIVCRMRLVTL